MPYDSETNAFPESALFTRTPVRGGHEVIIESAQHAQSLTDLDLADVSLSFFAFRDRLRFWRGQPGIEYISLFKNVGGDAGASLSHSHSQLIATTQTPTEVRHAIRRLRQYYAETGCCLHCDLIRGEQKAGAPIGDPHR